VLTRAAELLHTTLNYIMKDMSETSDKCWVCDVCPVLRAEVENLKQLKSASVGDDVISQSRREVAWLRQQLMNKEAEMNEMKRFVCRHCDLLCICHTPRLVVHVLQMEATLIQSSTAYKVIYVLQNTDTFPVALQQTSYIAVVFLLLHDRCRITSVTAKLSIVFDLLFFSFLIR